MQVSKVHAKTDLKTLEQLPATTLELNEIGKLTITCHRSIYFDPYAKNRATGAFVIVDSLTNATVGAGMIIGDEAQQDLDAAMKELRAGSGLELSTQVSPSERKERLGQVGATVWLTGLPGSGKVAVAYVLERKLFDLGHAAHVLSPQGESLDAMAVAAKALTDAGIVAVCALPAKTRADRAVAQGKVGAAHFVEVFVEASPELCQERKPGADLSGFEAPSAPDVTVSMEESRVELAVDAIIATLKKRGLVDLS
jgi:bifunctional enzyme CysN/CysC